MTERISITRRQVLAGLGATGLAASGAGLGTSAYLNDTEEFTGNSMTAGELDLKVDWEEHYYDGSNGREMISYTEAGDGYVGFPDPDRPHVWLEEDRIAEFMSATSVEAFPDPDNDGEQEIQDGDFTYDACRDGADMDDDLMPRPNEPATRSSNDDTLNDEDPAPLVDLQDVKPGDFGELTLSFHLCNIPGYVWLQAANVTESENGITEPEGAVDESPDDPELAEQIQTVWWYDSRGDNVLQTNCQEKLYLTDSGTDGTTTLFEVTLDDGAGVADLDELWPDGGSGNADFDQTDAIAVTPNGDEVIFYDKNSGHLGAYHIPTDTFTDEGAISGDPGGVVLAGYSPDGTLWAASQNTNQLYTVDRAGPTVTARGDTGISLQGADIVFASDGTLYIWTADSADEGLYRVDDPSTDPTAVPVDVSNIGNSNSKITGLAIRDAGTGHIVASDTANDEIVVIDRTDGSIVDRYPMQVGGSDYSYSFGDMAAGRYCGEVFRRGTLAEDLAVLASQGIPLDGNRASPFDELGGDSTSEARECFVPHVSHYIGFAWWLPTTVGNEIQGDSVGFDLGFYTEQCRHNDGAGQSA